MKLFEHEVKEIFRANGIAVPPGRVVSDPAGAVVAYEWLHVPSVVIKSQVLVGGRGKAGGIRFAASAGEAAEVTRNLMGFNIKGEIVKSVLVEPRLDISKELYLGITWDRSARAPVIVASASGGINIEDVAHENPEAIKKIHVDPDLGFEPFVGRELAAKVGIPREHSQIFAEITGHMYALFVRYDAELVESNPLALTGDGKLIAADARLNILDDALFRQKEFGAKASDRLSELPLLERKAKQLGVQYVELDGSVGIIGNGAGLTMATLDLVKYYGGEPANFLDAGGGSSEESFLRALGVLAENPKVKLIFVNILAGITRCDDVAKAIVKAKTELGLNKPLVIRLAGTNESEGRKILSENGMSAYSAMEEAAKEAVRVARAGEASA